MKPTWFRTQAMTLLAAATLLSAVVPSAYAVEGAAASTYASTVTTWLQGTKGLPAAEREKMYQSLTFDLKKLAYGDSLSLEPYAVVTYYNPSHPNISARIRIWTGMMVRNGSDLETTWDELWLDPQGRVAFASTDKDGYIPNYFSSASQSDFRKVDYLGIAPWGANIPTDAESKSTGSGSIPSDGMISAYGVDLSELGVESSSSQVAVKPASALPQVFSGITLPKDVKGHWAEVYIRELLIRKVVKGYEDGTINPDGTLTRAEFTALLVRILGLPAGNTVSGAYSDLEKHWAKNEIAAALANHLLTAPAEEQPFRPDEAITRLEMAQILANTLQQYQMNYPAANKTFTDAEQLSKTEKKALKAVSDAGLINGYEDGTFKPDHSLARAEAFKVLNILNHMKK
ncbi:S-layer homology domain-containing protein [Gorillibacterium sp. sgz5001074]|uniref:S-layer homology domain-containing protein n=1 Tax=Gorillibacterium sp. sgz5001074 TaxID=3446695 RepID=UPI003F66B127